jgi:hypothetical protein
MRYMFVPLLAAVALLVASHRCRRQLRHPVAQGVVRRHTRLHPAAW